MPAKFVIRALGRGSIAAYIKLALGVAWYFLWFCVVMLALAVLAYAGIVVLIGTGVLDRDILEAGARTQTIGPITITTDTDDELVWQLVVIAVLGGSVAVGGALIIVQRLRRLFANFTSGEPFSKDNAQHLRVIWIAMLVMELSRYAIAGTVKLLVMIFGQPERTEIDVHSPVNWTTWASVLILIVLAEVFREGARMREEQDLTI